MRSVRLPLPLLILTCLITSGYADDGKPLPFVDGSWTLVLLPDTQNYTKGHPKEFVSQTKWIADHASDRKIEFVMSEGDITNDNTPEQWKNAKTAFSMLDGKVPYALQLGNHDYRPKPLDKRATLANKYFPPALVEKSPDYGGEYEKGKLDNAYYLFTAGGRDWVALSLEFAPRDAVIDWANKTLDKYANRSAIICTHAYIDLNGKRFNYLDPKGRKVVANIGTNGLNDGEMMWNKLIRKHENIQFVFCGHVFRNGGAKRLDSRGDAGNVVHEILSDYQSRPNGGEGYLRLVEFLPDGKTVQIKTYSATRNDYMTDAENQFTVEIAPAPKKASQSGSE